MSSCITSVTSATAQSLPAGPGKAEFERICGACHSTLTVTQERMTPAGWAGTVNDRVARGAPGSQGDINKIITYLSTNFSSANSTALPEWAGMPPAGGSRRRTADSPYVKAALAALRAPLGKLTPVTAEMLRNPPPGDWLHWRRTYDGWAYSPLTQIN